MINKTAGKALLLSVAAFSVMMTGCGSNKATEAANEKVWKLKRKEKVTARHGYRST